jgi:hypothetical protein
MCSIYQIPSTSSGLPRNLITKLQPMAWKRVRSYLPFLE